MRSERGQALSALVSVVVFALLLVAGLVVDGGRQSAADRRVELAAAAAARAAVDETAAARVAGRRSDPGAAVAAARRLLAGDPEITATVTVEPDGAVWVQTRTEVSTVFLSLIGIRTLSATGSCRAQLFAD